ncbi:hypothetical protein H0H93_000636, partial [Arthromyces matolae]
RQVDHARTESHLNLGTWILRRAQHVQTKLSTAKEILLQCGHSKIFLREQWKLQVQSQTKPLPRQSQSAGKDAVEELLRLEDVLNKLKARADECDSILEDPSTPVDEFADAQIELATARERINNSKENIRRKRRALGFNDLQRLDKLKNDPYIAKRVNALALKHRLKERLRACKFELDRVERAYRHQVNGKKVNDQTQSSVKRREPSIQN